MTDRLLELLVALVFALGFLAVIGFWLWLVKVWG